MRGTDKLLQLVDGAPQLWRVARAALATGCPVIVALPRHAVARQAVLGDLPVQTVIVAGSDEGIAASIRAAAKAAGDGTAALILPADMPELTVADLHTILAAHYSAPKAILRGATRDQPGHPVLIPTDLVAELQDLRGDEGARGLLKAHPQRLRLVPLPDRHATLDLDTSEEWDAWAKHREGRRLAALRTEHPIPQDPLLAALHDPEDGVLAVVTDVIGASYRRPGTMMALFPDGRFAGELTNGCIEADVAIHAEKCRRSGEVMRLRYGAGSPFFDIRLPCGGALEVALFPRPDRATLAEIARRRARRDFFALRFDQAGRISLHASLATGWDGQDYVVDIVPDIAFTIFGEGPEAAVFTRLVGSADYPHRLVTPSPDTFEAVQRSGCCAVLQSGCDLPAASELDARTAVVTFFHEHDREITILKAALESPAFYVGAQGSNRVAARRREQLLAAGVGPQHVAKLHAPVGMIPSARDARTLAVSVLAEVIAMADQR